MNPIGSEIYINGHESSPRRVIYEKKYGKIIPIDCYNSAITYTYESLLIMNYDIPVNIVFYLFEKEGILAYQIDPHKEIRVLIIIHGMKKSYVDAFYIDFQKRHAMST